MFHPLRLLFVGLSLRLASPTLKARPMGQIKVVGPGYSIWTPGLEACVTLCDSSDQCDAINYHSSSHKCRLFTPCTHVYSTYGSSDYYFYSKRPQIVDQGYVFDKERDTCIKLMDTDTDMSQGDTVCTKQNGRLLSLSGPSSMDLAVKLMIRARARPQYVWAGGGDPWDWKSDFTRSSYYPSYGDGLDASGNLCSVLEITGQWHRVPCNHSRYMSLCEVPAFYTLFKFGTLQPTPFYSDLQPTSAYPTVSFPSYDAITPPTFPSYYTYDPFTTPSRPESYPPYGDLVPPAPPYPPSYYPPYGFIPPIFPTSYPQTHDGHSIPSFPTLTPGSYPGYPNHNTPQPPPEQIPILTVPPPQVPLTTPYDPIPPVNKPSYNTPQQPPQNYPSYTSTPPPTYPPAQPPPNYPPAQAPPNYPPAQPPPNYPPAQPPPNYPPAQPPPNYPPAQPPPAQPPPTQPPPNYPPYTPPAQPSYSPPTIPTSPTYPPGGYPTPSPPVHYPIPPSPLPTATYPTSPPVTVPASIAPTSPPATYGRPQVLPPAPTPFPFYTTTRPHVYFVPQPPKEVPQTPFFGYPTTSVGLSPTTTASSYPNTYDKSYPNSPNYPAYHPSTVFRHNPYQPQYPSYKPNDVPPFPPPNQVPFNHRPIPPNASCYNCKRPNQVPFKPNPVPCYDCTITSPPFTLSTFPPAIDPYFPPLLIYQPGYQGLPPQAVPTPHYKGYVPPAAHATNIPYRPITQFYDKPPFQGKTFIVKGDQVYEIPTLHQHRAWDKDYSINGRSVDARRNESNTLHNNAENARNSTSYSNQTLEPNQYRNTNLSNSRNKNDTKLYFTLNNYPVNSLKSPDNSMSKGQDEAVNNKIANEQTKHNTTTVYNRNSTFASNIEYTRHGKAPSRAIIEIQRGGIVSKILPKSSNDT